MNRKIIKIIKGIKNPKLIVLYLNSRGFFKLLPDKLFLKFYYRIRTGQKLNLETPTSFNEKLQWLKLYDRNPEYTQLVDKYEVRKYIANEIGNEYLIPLIGVYDSFDEIDFPSLPNQFVIKSTHDSGGVVIYDNKAELDVGYVREKINKSLKRNYYYYGREWPYKHVSKRIIIEMFLEDEKTTIPNDYKLWVFNGEVKFINVHFQKNDETYINIYNLNWELQQFGMEFKNDLSIVHNKPKNLEKMIKLAEKLGKDKQFVRIDFYEVNDQIYFGEITFFPTSGFIRFYPNHDELDKMYGDMLNLRMESFE